MQMLSSMTTTYRQDSLLYLPLRTAWATLPSGASAKRKGLGRAWAEEAMDEQSHLMGNADQISLMAPSLDTNPAKDWFLVLVLVVLFLLCIVVSVYILVNFQHPEDRNQARSSLSSVLRCFLRLQVLGCTHSRAMAFALENDCIDYSDGRTGRSPLRSMTGFNNTSVLKMQLGSFNCCCSVQAYAPKAVVVLSLTLAMMSVLLLPLDIANRASCDEGVAYSECTFTLPMRALWFALYMAMFGILVLILPFMLFFYESDTEEYARCSLSCPNVEPYQLLSSPLHGVYPNA